MAEIASVTVSPNPIRSGQQYTITVTMTGTVSTATAIDIWIRNDPTGALFYDSLITVPANQLTGTFTNNFPLTLGNRTLRIEAKKHGAAATAVVRMFDLIACDTHGIEVYKDASNPALLSGMVGSRVFIKVVTAQSDGSYENLLDVPSGNDIRVYCIYAGGYSWTTSTVNINGVNCARITFNLLPGYSASNTNKTKLAVFANKTYEPAYGISVENDDNQKLVSTIYPVPVFLQKVSFQVADIWSYQFDNRAAIYRKTITVGSANANKLVLWRIPINPQSYDNIWYTGTAFIESSANNQATIEMSVIMLPPVPTNVSYSFPEAYIFQLDNLDGLTTTSTYGIELRDSNSKKIFSSDFTHLSIPTLNYINWPSQTVGSNVTLTDSIYSTNNEVNVTNNHGFFLPEFSAVQYEPYNDGTIQGAYIKTKRGAFRRRYSEDWNIEWSAVTTTQVLAPNVIVNSAYANLYAPVNSNLYFSADTSQYGADSGSSGGGTAYTVNISLYSGAESCTIASGNTTCDSDATYRVTSVTNPSGQSVAPTAYQWSLPEANQGPISFSIVGSSTSQNVLVRGTFNAINKSTALKVIVTVDGIAVEKVITITHTHNADTTKPEISISASATTIGPNQTSTLTFTTTESTTTFTSSDITLTPATGSGSISNFTGSGTTYTALFTAPNVTSNTSCQITVAANTFTDLAGNNNNASTGNPTIITNATKPTVTISGPSAVTINNVYAVTFTLSEAVGTNLFTSGDLTVYGGTISDFAAVPGSNVTYTASLNTQSTMPLAEVAVITVALNAFNNAYGVGNDSTQLSIPYDTGRPGVTISANSNAILTTQTATITVTFTESVTGFVIGDITASGGTKGTLSGSGTTYSFTWTPPTTAGTYYFNIAQGVAVDAAGNSNTAATQYQIVVSLPDTTSPSNIMYVYNGPNKVQTANIVQGSTIDVYIDWDEAVVNFSNITPNDLITDDIYVSRDSDSTLVAGFLSNLTGLAPNTSRYYKVTFTAPSNHVGSYTIYVPTNVCTDAAGNNNNSTSSANQVTVSVAAPDTTAPSLVIFGVPAAVKRSTVFTVDFTWSEAVYDFTSDDVTITDSDGNTITPGTLTATSIQIYSLSVTSPAYDTTLSIYVKANRVRDGSNNYAGQSITRTVLVDSIQPAPTLTPSSSTVGASGTVTVTLNTGEATTQTLANLLSGITVSGGSKYSISGSGSTYTFSWTLPSTSGSYNITIPANTYQDAAGNYNTAASSSVTVDATAPTMSITVYNSVGYGEQVGVSYTPSETISGFTINDISTAQSGTNTTVGNGTVTDFAAGAGNYTTYYNAPHWNTTAFKDATTITRTINVATQSYSDVVGNLGSSASATVTIYNNYAQISSTSVTSTYGALTSNRVIRGSENATIAVTLNKANNTGQTIYVDLYIKNATTTLASYTGANGIAVSNSASTGSKTIAVASGWDADCTVEVSSSYIAGSATTILYTCTNTLGGKTFSGYYGAGGAGGGPVQSGSGGGTTSAGVTEAANTIGSATVIGGGGGTLSGAGSGGGYGTIGGTLAWRWSGGLGGLGTTTYGGGGAGVTGIAGGSPSTYTGGSPSVNSLSVNADPALAVAAATNLYNFFTNVFGSPSAGTALNQSASGWGSGGAGAGANNNGGAGVVGGGGGAAAYGTSNGSGGKGGDGAVVLLYTVRGQHYIVVYKSNTTSTNSNLSTTYPGYNISVNSVNAGVNQSFTFSSGTYDLYVCIWAGGGGGAGRPASGGGESDGGGGGGMVVHYYL